MRPTYLCTAAAGYDGPTGLGTLDGVSGFDPPAPAVPAAPSAPTTVCAVAGDGRATVPGRRRRWTAAARSAGTSSPRASAASCSRSGPTPRPRLRSCSAGWTNGTAYTFTVAAMNGVGAGLATAGSAPVTPFDAMTTKYAQLGGSSSYLGAPSGAEAFLTGGGRSQAYAGGAIYWSAATGAHVVRGGILAQVQGARRHRELHRIPDDRRAALIRWRRPVQPFR